MKMTMHIDEEVLAQVMKLTGAKTKTQAVEMALTDMARRHKMQQFFERGLGMTPDEMEAYGRAVMAAQTDPMDTDEKAVQRFIAKSDARRAAREGRDLRVAEDSLNTTTKSTVQSVSNDVPKPRPLPDIVYPKTRTNEQPRSR